MSEMVLLGGAFTSHDAEKIDGLIRTVGTWRKKAGLTIPEVLTALRYSCDTPEEWNDVVARANNSIVFYRAYYDSQEAEAGPKPDKALLDMIAQGQGYKSYSAVPGHQKRIVDEIAARVK